MVHDIVVIGGGITGLGIARLAARNGLSVAVVERGDLASGTSSASSHMLHGGLRYLEHGRFSLVRESLAERAAVSRMAPGLVRLQRFMVPVFRHGRVGSWKLHAGLLLYDHLAGRSGFAPHAMVRRAEARALEPDLDDEDLTGAGLYTDAVMDDARLAIAVARDAAAHGAAIHTYSEVTAARPTPEGSIDLAVQDRIAGGERTVRGRVLVNAAGPWVDRVRVALRRSLEPGSPDPAPLLRPSRGVHLVYPALTRGHGLTVFARTDGRVFFVVPFGSHALVGTTEVEVPSPPPTEAGRASLDEIRYLRAEVARVLPRFKEVPPLALMSGIRPLIASGDDVGSASREHVVLTEKEVITIAGGKYTSFRIMARDVVERARIQLGRAATTLRDEADPLPAPLAHDAPIDKVAEFAVEHEFAKRVADVIRRRSRLWLTPDRGRFAAPKIATAMGRMLGWSPERVREEFQSYDAALWEEESLLQRARGG